MRKSHKSFIYEGRSRTGKPYKYFKIGKEPVYLYPRGDPENVELESILKAIEILKKYSSRQNNKINRTFYTLVSLIPYTIKKL